MKLEAKDIAQMFRMGCGAAIMITSMLTGINGQFQMVGLFLMGVPFELVGRTKK